MFIVYTWLYLIVYIWLCIYIYIHDYIYLWLYIFMIIYMYVIYIIIVYTYLHVYITYIYIWFCIYWYMIVYIYIYDCVYKYRQLTCPFNFCNWGCCQRHQCSCRPGDAAALEIALCSRWESQDMGYPNIQKTMGKPWENHGKMGIYVENHHF